MGSGEFCPRCGDPVEPRSEPRPGNPSGHRARLCDDCYFEEFDLVDAPEELVVEICSGCGAVKRGEQWVDVGADDYTDVAIEETTETLGIHVEADDVEWMVEPEQIDRNTIEMHCYFTGVVRDTVIEAEHDVRVRFNRTTCTRCSRIAGEYYASTVQVRAMDRTPTETERTRAAEIANERVDEREGDRNAFITEISESNEGINVRLSTTQLGRTVATHIQRELGGTVTDSQTLITEDEDGNEVYRVTYAVRLPPFPAGTVIEPAGEDPVLVHSAHGNLKGRRLTTGKQYEADAEDGIAPDARRLGDTTDAQETTLVAVEDDHAVQVLDPDTYEAKTIPRPSYLDPDTDTVPVIKHREGLHVLPEDATASR
ncbi:60S ribosomal export protein NMD3 [Halocatena salina]|uniref:NMD3-related protein n=1 Tax=Halocatena salina TaxID=2934340 RepID=A0A8U0A196_9EURY|nr:60S ribosomal export protein NMD3 [Halocatena salina]UPM41757.1 NMD3-related protein [Halocatena salina]